LSKDVSAAAQALEISPRWNKSMRDL